MGAADAERDVRGFALKFYTEEGNWDLVGNNTPVFFVRDPLKFPDFIHTQKRHPTTNLRSPTAMWDFWSLSPESLHQVTILMSDRGIPTTPMHMNGYGSHTYSLWNDAGERFWVKFHFKTRQGHEHYTNAEAESVIGKTREKYQEDLFGAIERGPLPAVDRAGADHAGARRRQDQLQSVRPDQGLAARDYPPIEIGVMELNRNADNYFAEIENAAFSPSNVVPGISYSPGQDAAGAGLLLCRRASLPARHALRGAAGERAEGRSATTTTRTARCGSSATTPAIRTPTTSRTRSTARRRTRAVEEPPLRISGDATRYDHRIGNDDYGQPRALFNLFDDAQKARLFSNIAAAMDGVPDHIVERQFALFDQVHPDYGRGVREAVARSKDADPPKSISVTDDTPQHAE